MSRICRVVACCITLAVLTFAPYVLDPVQLDGLYLAGDFLTLPADAIPVFPVSQKTPKCLTQSPGLSKAPERSACIGHFLTNASTCKPRSHVRNSIPAFGPESAEEPA